MKEQNKHIYPVQNIDPLTKYEVVVPLDLTLLLAEILASHFLHLQALKKSTLELMMRIIPIP